MKYLRELDNYCRFGPADISAFLLSGTEALDFESYPLRWRVKVGKINNLSPIRVKLDGRKFEIY